MLGAIIIFLFSDYNCILKPSIFRGQRHLLVHHHQSRCRTRTASHPVQDDASEKMEEEEVSRHASNVSQGTPPKLTEESPQISIADLRAELAEKDKMIAAKDKLIAEHNRQLVEKDNKVDKHRRERFVSKVGGDVEPWGLDSDALITWLEVQTKTLSSNKSWNPLIDALRGFDGVALLAHCDENAKPPWVKLAKGAGGTPLRKLGLFVSQVTKLNEMLNMKHGIGFYHLLFQSCNQLSPLMDLSWVSWLGEGAFGQVHLVKDREIHDLWAVKFIKVENDGLIQEASKEMQHHKRAAESSEFVVKIKTWGQVGDEFLFVQMEYCAGGDVRKLLNKADPSTIGISDDELRWKLYRQICEGLASIHSAGLIHMDLKPENGASVCCTTQGKVSHQMTYYLQPCCYAHQSYSRTIWTRELRTWDWSQIPTSVQLPHKRTSAAHEVTKPQKLRLGNSRVRRISSPSQSCVLRWQSGLFLICRPTTLSARCRTGVLFRSCGSH